MKQYTRIYKDKATGEIRHVHTQTSPIKHEPVEGDYDKEDMVIEHDEDRHVRARELIDNMETQRGKVRLKGGKAPSLIPSVKIKTK